MACTYRFTGTDGKQIVIKGQAAFKAFLADGGLEQLGVAAPEAPAFQRRQQNLSDLENVTFQGYVPAEVPRVQATRKLKGLVAKYDSGKINPESFVLQVRILAQRMGEASSTKETNRLFAERERGADIIQEKLLAARRRGEIDPQTTEFAMWLLGKNPNIASGLAITVKQQPQGLRGTAGDYNPAEEVIRIFKGAAKPTTAVHEILHHSERMMPEEIQDGIRKEWARAYTNALKKATPEQRVAIENMLDAMAGDANAQKIVREAFNKGTLDVDKHYQLVNPSEYWAVNATDILSRRYEADSWIAKAKQWLSEMLQKAKSIFGLRSDAPVVKGLQAVLEGKGEKLTKKMLGGQAAELEQPSFQRRQTTTPEFTRWFGDSKAVNADGTPKIMYHGTGQDISTFRAKQAGAIFLTDDSSFAESFANISREWMERNPRQVFTPRQIENFLEEGRTIAEAKGTDPIDEYLEIARNNLPSSSNIMPVYAKAENPFDYENPKHVKKIESSFDEIYKDPTLWTHLQSMGSPTAAIRSGLWPVIESAAVQKAIKAAGFDSFYVAEADRKNLAVYSPSQIKSATGNVGTFDVTNPDIRYQRRQNIFGQPAPLANWTAPLETKGDNVIYALQNKQIDTKRVIEAITQAGNQIENDWNVYLQEELFHGRTAKQTTDFIQTELRPLVEDMQKRGVSLAELEEYLHNRHAEERNAQIAKVNPNMPDGGSNIDTADAEAYLAGLTPDQKRDFTALAARIDAINQNTRDLLVNSGLESQETIDAWEKSYSNYVPLYRDDIDFSTQGAGGMRTGQGYSVKGAASRRAMGSKKPVIDILANIAMQRERTIVRAEKNRVAMSLYGLAVQNPNTDFWLAIDPAGQKKPKQAIADLISMGINPLDAQNIIEEPKQQYIDPNTGLVAERINPAIRSNPMVVATRINGVEKYVFFNANDARSQRMASALKNLDADQLGYITSNFIAPVTRWFAQVNTQFNPIFGAINFIRDVQGGVLNLSSTALAGEQATVAGEVLPAMKGIYQAIRAERKGRPALAGSYAQLWDEFQEVGGQTGYRDQFVNSEDRAKALQRMLDPASWADSPLGKVFTAGGSLKVPMEVARKTAAPLFDWLSDYNQTMENAVRLASYKVALDKGLSKEEAASIAKNLTVNFNRKGQIATQAGAWYAFFNASIQGNARYIETLRSPIGKKIIAGGLMIGTAQALLLAAAGFDEDEPPDFIKERNLVIPLGTGGKYFTFPMPLGFNVIPNTSRVMTEWALSGFKNTPKRIGQITGAFLETFNPIGNSGWSVQTLAPTIFDPVVALAENKDFTGKNIAKKDRSDLSPTPGYTRAKDTASWFSKQFSYYLNLASGGTDFKPGLFSPTPDQIDYLIGQITGGVGREAMKIEQSITGAVKGEEVAPYKIPIVGRFYGDTEATANISGKFYENLTKLNKHEAEIEGRKKRGETLNEYYKDNPEARLYKKANDFESDITRLRKRLKALKERDASKESIKLVNAQITAKMKRLNDMVKEAEK